jgi:hypothetical protein
MRTIQISDKTYSDLGRIGRRLQDNFSMMLERQAAPWTPEDVIPFLIGFYNQSEPSPIIDADEVQKVK